MADKPLYVTEQDDKTIQQRMLGNMPERYDKSEGGFAWDTQAPLAVELAQSNVQAQRILETWTDPTGEWVDLKLAEAGLERKKAALATGAVTFTGTAGLVIEAGRRVSTASVSGRPAVLFVTDATLTLDGTGQGTVGITAVTAGSAGNVAAGTVAFKAEAIPGVSSLANVMPTTGGTEREGDPAAMERFKEARRNPSSSGNEADYKKWAKEVQGVGGAAVVPVRDGPGTVSVAIIGEDKLPASAALVDQVQNYMAPPWRGTTQAETFTLSGVGASLDNTRSDDTGDSVKLVYDVSGAAMATHGSMHNSLPKRPGAAAAKPGIWQARTRLMVSSAVGSADMLSIGVWNATAGTWAKTRPGGSVDAATVYQASELPTIFSEVAQEFYWNGQDALDLVVGRLTTDTTATIVWVDQVEYRSTFSKDTGEAKAPVGARVTVETAGAVGVDIAVTLVIQVGYVAASVRSAVQTALATYMRGLAFATDNDVRYGRVVQTILDVPGVQDYSNLLVNGASTNVMVGDQQVAVLGTVTLT